eukprot:TRINITY_DN5615_c0_g1_i1.p1 TRINITY_DN5615_c0_g1~~TRINITY_DN5615_c0_g1_i1.p1  ORF type:complete len:846 (+),score=198.16 TRINITY_DN5615_c0_g1_i1:67-2604(+)
MRRRSAARREDEHKSAAALDPGALLAALLRKQHHTTADLDGCASLSRQAAEVGCVSGAQKAITDTLRDLETMSAVKLGRCMSAMLPLAVGVIPHDCQGAGVVPHEHSLVRKETCRWMPSFHGPIPTTGRICDQCNREIDGIVYWTCGLREGVPQHAEHAVGCDIDFCPACHEQLEALFKGADQVRIKWVSDELVPLIAAALWHLSDDQRAELCCMLGDDWAVESFRDLAGVVRDVANARAVHLEDVRDDGEAAASDDCFWRIMFLLQMLAEANVRFAHVPRTDEEVPRGPRVDRSFFTLVAMDKCESYAEIRRWMRTQGVMMAVDCDDEEGEGEGEEEGEEAEEGGGDQPMDDDEWEDVEEEDEMIQLDDIPVVTSPEPEASGAVTAALATQSVVAAAAAASAASGSPPPLDSHTPSPPPNPPVPASAAKVGLQGMLGLRHLSSQWRCFLAYTDLAPPAFLRDCLTGDVLLSESRRQALRITVSRANPGADLARHMQLLSEEVLKKPLRVRFSGEPADGSGVNREFCNAALAELLNTTPSDAGWPAGLAGQPLWVCEENSRCWWPSVAPTHQFTPQAKANWVLWFRTCGYLLGQALLGGHRLPAVFPSAIFAVLLREIGGPKPTFCLTDLSGVDPQLARSLSLMMAHTGDDLDEVFGSLCFPGRGEVPLTRDNRQDMLDRYLEWFFSAHPDRGRTGGALAALCDGFKIVFGRSALLRCRISADQLEEMLCGGCGSIDVDALRGAARIDGWAADDATYLRGFWDILKEFSEQERKFFLLFVSASDRAPLRGWTDLVLHIQKHGSASHLPTAFTCFKTLLLPRYESLERLRQSLLTAIGNCQGFGLV